MSNFDERNKHWRIYKNIASEMVNTWVGLNGRNGDKPKVLKTDVYNELLDLPEDGGVISGLYADFTILEYEELFVRKMKKLDPGLKIFQGDIRNLEMFEDNTFDIVMDFSTIDHIKGEEVEKVLSEYARVLKPDGRAVIVAWVTTNEDVSRSTEERNKTWQSLDQYFFSYNIFKGHLEEKFKGLTESPIENTGQVGDTWLNAFFVINNK